MLPRRNKFPTPQPFPTLLPVHIGQNQFIKRSRPAYALLIILVVALGLASRSGVAELLPGFLSTYSGDTLWTLMVFLIIGFILPGMKTPGVAGIALAFSFCIEFSQLYQADWINAVRGNRLAALVLGNGFLWSDLVCYTVGVLIGFLGEILSTRIRRR